MSNPDQMDVEEAANATSTSPSDDAAGARTANGGGKKRARSPAASAGADGAPPTSIAKTEASTVSAVSVASAAQLVSSMNLQGLYNLLTAAISNQTSSSAASSSTSGGGTATLPTVEQVRQAATKSVQECPPFVHLSKLDSAPQLKVSVDDRRLVVKGGMRGYRMTRASHGVSSGNYYYECLILEPPSVREIVDSFPPNKNVRLSKKLQADMQQALKEEAEGLSVEERTSTFGAHVRLGWSMRTGDLQAPVGYDRWSYGIRDIEGSKVHASKREDNWGGDDFGPGDVVGCAISLQQGDDHIRFFKNGQPMGDIIISKGKRVGGSAFSSIPEGVYYPAISLYMGASVRVNPGPHFVYPPKKLPGGIKLSPMSDLCPIPVSVADAEQRVQKEKTFRKPDIMQSFLGLVRAEAEVLQDVYQNHKKNHIREIKEEREKRGLKADDLEE